MSDAAIGGVPPEINDDAWRPLEAPDHVLLGFLGLWQLSTLLVCLHLIWCRQWPPYVTKNATLLVATGFSGVLWSLSMTVTWGFWARRPGDILANCVLDVFMSWATLWVHLGTFFLRIYRLWKLLVKHDGNMWSTELQLMFVSSPCLLPTIVSLAWPVYQRFDPVSNSCIGLSELDDMTITMYVLILVMIIWIWFVCARHLRNVRKQFNEFESMALGVLSTTLVLLSYPVVVLFLLDGYLLPQRRLAMLYPVMTTWILFWSTIREPMMKKILGDEKYLFQFTHGFSNIPTPAQMKSSLEEQLSVDQLRTNFRKYIKTKVAQELLDFYQESLDREEVFDFFERQAVTMRIIDRYVSENARDQINISHGCRKRLLMCDVTAFDIFDESRDEVLHLMETNFAMEFVQTYSFKKLTDDANKEAKELALLRGEGLAPGVPAEKVQGGLEGTSLQEEEKFTNDESDGGGGGKGFIRIMKSNSSNNSGKEKGNAGWGMGGGAMGRLLMNGWGGSGSGAIEDGEDQGSSVYSADGPGSSGADRGPEERGKAMSILAEDDFNFYEGRFAAFRSGGGSSSGLGVGVAGDDFNNV